MRTKRKKPTAVHKANGNPSGRPLNEEEPMPSGKPECPDWLSDEARNEWNRLSGELDSLGMLTMIDQGIFAVHCQCWADWRAAWELVQKTGVTTRGYSGGYVTNPAVGVMKTARDGYIKTCVELGLTPSSRSVMITKKRKDAKDLDSFAHTKPKAADLKLAK